MRLTHPRSRVSVASLLALFPLGLLPRTDGPPTMPSATVSVSIDYDAGSGTLSVSPDPVTVHRGDQVDWKSDAGPWRIIVPSDDTPFGPGARGNGIGAQKGGQAGAAVAANARFGTYKYIVALYDGSEVHILDPEVVVGPGS